MRNPLSCHVAVLCRSRCGLADRLRERRFVSHRVASKRIRRRQAARWVGAVFRVVRERTVIRSVLQYAAALLLILAAVPLAMRSSGERPEGPGSGERIPGAPVSHGEEGRGLRWLRSVQQPDGSFQEGWTRIPPEATVAVVIGLLAEILPAPDRDPLLAAGCRYLAHRQRPDGGFVDARGFVDSRALTCLCVTSLFQVRKPRTADASGTNAVLAAYEQVRRLAERTVSSAIEESERPSMWYGQVLVLDRLGREEQRAGLSRLDGWIRSRQLGDGSWTDPATYGCVPDRTVATAMGLRALAAIARSWGEGRWMPDDWAHSVGLDLR